MTALVDISVCCQLIFLREAIAENYRVSNRVPLGSCVAPVSFLAHSGGSASDGRLGAMGAPGGWFPMETVEQTRYSKEMGALVEKK